MNRSSHSELTYFNGNQYDSQEQLISDLSEFIKDSDELQRLAEQLERRSSLEKKLRKYRTSDTSETFSSRWIAYFGASILLDERQREEWLGDLMELHKEMVNKHYPRWAINLIDIGRTGGLILAVCQIKFTDLISQFFSKKA